MLGITPPGLHFLKQPGNVPSGYAGAYRPSEPASSIGKLLLRIKNAVIDLRQALPIRRPSCEPRPPSFDSTPHTIRPDAPITLMNQNRTNAAGPHASSFENLLQRALETPDSPAETQLLHAYRAAEKHLTATSQQYLEQTDSHSKLASRLLSEHETKIRSLPEYQRLLTAIENARNAGDDALAAQHKRQLDAFAFGRDLWSHTALHNSPDYQTLVRAKNVAKLALDNAINAQEDAIKALSAYWDARGENVDYVPD